MDLSTLLHNLFFDYTLRTVALGTAVIGTVSGALGTFAVLRKQSLLGDAISHAALPGVVLAFILTRSKSSIVLLVGAMIAGWLATLLVMAITRYSRIKRDSALGIALSTFFGFGILLLAYTQTMADARQAGLNRFLFGQAATIVQRDVITMALLGAFALAMLLLFWKEFKLLSFDPEYAATLGFPVRALDVTLTTLLVIAIVIGLQGVGVILMSSMVVAPAAAARQWTDRLGLMVLLAALFGALSSISGAIISSTGRGLATGPVIVLVMSGVVVISLLFAPNRGLVWNWARQRRNRRRLRRETVLSDLYFLGKQHPDSTPWPPDPGAARHERGARRGPAHAGAPTGARVGRAGGRQRVGAFRHGPGRGGAAAGAGYLFPDRANFHHRPARARRGPKLRPFPMVLSASVEIQMIATVVAAACALPGTFLVLRRMAMMSDAISHTVLLGIVLAFFVVQQFGHPLLLIGATAVGVITVALTEALNNTKLVKEDAAIGLVFPALFSTAVILIGVFARNVHLDEHVIFQGDLAFAPFDRAVLFGMDLGPRTFVVMSVVLLINLIFLTLFYKELKLSTFDEQLAATFGFRPTLLHYGLMTLVSITAVGAFDAVGSILVIALMIVPPAAAYLLTDRLPLMMGLSVLIGVLSALTGYWVARWLNTNLGGAMVTMTGVFFGLTFLFSPQRGLLALARRRLRQRWEFAQIMLAVHLLHHEDTPEALDENRVDHLSAHLRWEPAFAEKVVHYAQRHGVVAREDDHLHLTDSGRKVARQAMVQ